MIPLLRPPAMRCIASLCCWVWCLLSIWGEIAATSAQSQRISAAFTEQSKISAKTVRLPNHGDVRYRIEAYGGTYSWESLMPDIVSIVEQGPGYAIVAPKSSGKSIIFAKDPQTGSKPCDVYVSDIQDLEIVTPARRINVDDVDQLAVQGYDAERNLFTSLEGISFDWRIRDHNILQHTQMRETEAYVSGQRTQLEEEGKYSDVLMVRGKATGQTLVSVKTENQKVAAKDVLLTISENVMLFPTYLWTIPGAEVQFGVKVYKSGSELADLPFLTLPTPDFSFEASNKKLIDVDSKTGFASLIATGTAASTGPARAQVTVKDNRIANNTATSMVATSEPSLMRIVVRPDDGTRPAFTTMDDWNSLYRQPSLVNLVEGRKYVAWLQLENSDYTTLALPNNIETSFDCAKPCPLEISSGADKEKTRPSKAWAIPFVAKTVGKASLKMDKLKLFSTKPGGKDKKKATPVSFSKLKPAELQVQVYTPLKASLESVVLPPKHEFSLTITGGTGSYEYLSDSLEVVVDTTGKITTKTAVTDARVTIRDRANFENVVEVMVHVRELGKLAFEPVSKQVPFIMTSEKGGVAKSVDVPVVGIPQPRNSGLDESDWRFHSCAGLMPEASLVEPDWIAKVIAVDTTNPRFGTCGSVKVRPSQTGDVTLHFPANTVPFDAQEISFFRPIQIEFVNQLPFLPPVISTTTATSTTTASAVTTVKKQEEPLTTAAVELGAKVLLKFTQGPLVEKTGKTKKLKLMAAPGASTSKAADVDKIATITEETDDGFLVQCQDTEGVVVLEGSIFLPSEQLETTTRAHLHCAKPDFLRIFSREREQFALRDALYPMSAVCGSRKEHDLVTVVYAQNGRPLLSLKYPSTMEWKSNAVVTPAKQNGALAKLQVECPADSAEPESDGAQVVITAAYLGKQDKVTLRPAHPVEVEWPGTPGSTFVFGAWYLFTIRGGSRQWPLKLSKSKELKIMPLKDQKGTTAGGQKGGKTNSTIAAAVSSDTSADKVVPENIIGDMSALKPASYRAPDCQKNVCRGQWHLTSEVLGEGEVRISDDGLLGAKPIELSFDFQKVGALEFRHTEKQGELGKPVLVRLDMYGTSSSGGLVHLSPQLWKSAGLSCRVSQGASGQQQREMTKYTGLEFLRGVGDDGFLRFKNLEVGDYTARCSTKDKSVLSPVLSIKIFPRLQLFPARLVGLPRQTAEFALLGGATSGTILRYTSKDPSVVSVDHSTGLLHLTSEGSTTVEVEVREAESEQLLATASGHVTVAWPKRATLIAAPAKPTDDMKLSVSRNFVAQLFTADETPFTPALIGDPQNGDGCMFAWKVDAGQRLHNNAQMSAELRDGVFASSGIAAFGDEKLEGLEAASRASRVQVDISCAGGTNLKLEQAITLGRPILRESSRVTFLPLQSALDFTSLVTGGVEGLTVDVAQVRGGSTFTIQENLLQTGPEEGDGVLLMQHSAREPGLVAVSARKIDEIRLLHKGEDELLTCQENCLERFGNKKNSNQPNHLHWATEEQRQGKLTLPVGSSAVVAVSLFASGTEMLYPDSGVELTAFSAHNSIVTAEVAGSNEIRVRAKDVGCSAVQFTVQHHNQTFYEVLPVCTKRETLLPQSKLPNIQVEEGVEPAENLLLHTGARANFFVASKTRYLVIRVKEYSETSHKKLVEKEISDLLLESRKSTSTIQIDSSSTSAMTTSTLARVVSHRRLSETESTSNAHELYLDVSAILPEQVEALWSASLSGLGPYLEQHWDMSFGIRSESSLDLNVGSTDAVADAKRCPNGRWSSSNPRVLHFANANVGTAVAKAIGEAKVLYCGEFEQSTSVLVEKVATIKAPRDVQLTTHHGNKDKAYRIPLALLDEEKRVFETHSPFFIQNTKIKCAGDAVLSTFFEISHIEPGDLDGGPACNLKKRIPETAKLLTLSERIEAVKLRVDVWDGSSTDFDDSSRVTAGQLTLPFTPGFVILDVTGRELDIAQGLRLTSASPAVSLRIWTGGRDVQVRASDPSIKVVQEKSTATLQSVNVLLQEVTGRNAAVVVEGEQGFLETIQVQLPGAKPVRPVAATKTQDYSQGEGSSLWQYIVLLLIVAGSCYFLFGGHMANPAPQTHQMYAPHYQHYDTPFRKADETTLFDNSGRTYHMDPRAQGMEMTNSPQFRSGRDLGMNAGYM
ncbi:unnamed protein product [Amoebophrya sp. A120]|nr:unnamed protein product [Amoebophrya sp. A120]|eukprot:GSA120T00004966001.1